MQKIIQNIDVVVYIKQSLQLLKLSNLEIKNDKVWM